MMWTESLGCMCCALVWAIVPAGDHAAVLSILTTPEEAPALALALAGAAAQLRAAAN